MDFLFKDRGSGKRTIKPSKDSESLEACMAAEESDDSDFEVGKFQNTKVFMIVMMISFCHHGVNDVFCDDDDVFLGEIF